MAAILRHCEPEHSGKMFADAVLGIIAEMEEASDTIHEERYMRCWFWRLHKPVGKATGMFVEEHGARLFVFHLGEIARNVTLLLICSTLFFGFRVQTVATALNATL